MNSLIQPKKEDLIFADDIRAMVISIIKNNVTAGIGLSEKQTLNGKIISLKQTSSRPSAFSSSNPRTFDLVPGSAGKLKLVRCYFQMADKFVQCADEPEFTPAAGKLCAVINTSVESGSVTAVMNFAYDADTPELFPITIYILDSSGGIVCDCRGSQVVAYG